MSSSSHYTFFLLTILIASSLQVQARESRFFSKTTPNQQGDQEMQAPDFTQLSAFKDNNSPPEFKEEPFTSFRKSQNHGLYGDESIPTVNNPDQNPPTVDFTSFMSIPHKYDESFASKDLHSSSSGYGMSDTRVYKNGKYYNDVQNDQYQNGSPYQIKDSNDGGFEYPTYRGVGHIGSGFGSPYYKGFDDSSVGESKYEGYGSYGNNGNHETNYNEEEDDEFVP